MLISAKRKSAGKDKRAEILQSQGRPLGESDIWATAWRREGRKKSFRRKVFQAQGRTSLSVWEETLKEVGDLQQVKAVRVDGAGGARGRTGLRGNRRPEEYLGKWAPTLGNMEGSPSVHVAGSGLPPSCGRRSTVPFAEKEECVSYAEKRWSQRMKENSACCPIHAPVPVRIFWPSSFSAPFIMVLLHWGHTQMSPPQRGLLWSHFLKY